MPNRILLVLLFCTGLTASACWEVRPAVIPKIVPPAFRTTEQEVSILTKTQEIDTRPEESAAGLINAELVEGVIVITPERAIKKDRNEEKDYRVIRVTCVAYCPCSVCCGRMTGLTKTGTNAWRPGIAVDPRVIPLGSIIHVPGYERAEWAEADDTGKKIKGRKIDIRFQYHWEAREWGIKYLDIKVRKPNK